MRSLGVDLNGRIIHHDQDSVYTSYRWLRAILLEDGMRISCPENGAKGNPWIESLWRRTKTEIGSRIAEAQSLPALREVLNGRFQYYNQERRHSSIGYGPPREHLKNALSTSESESRITAAN
jgi:transposase InsO family protein